ncbi:hypothetical protein ACEPAF_1643 [Sanghuangporus sanghuang]
MSSVAPKSRTATETASVLEATDTSSKEVAASEPAAVPRTPKRRRDVSPAPESPQTSPGSPDSIIRKVAARRVGERSLTPYPPPMFSPRVSSGTRSVTPYPGFRRRLSRSGTETPMSSLSSSPNKENESFIRSAAPSPSPKKKGKFDWKDRGRSISRTPSNESLFTFGVPTNTPRTLSRSSSPSETSSDESVKEPGTPPPLLERAIVRLFEREIEKKCKELTESPLADVTEAYTELDVFSFDANDILCPPNTPDNDRVIRDW